MPRDPYSDGLFLDRNERTVFHQRSLMSRLSKRLARAPLNLYPDVDAFYEKLASWIGVSQNQIYVTEGVSGAIKSLMETIAYPGNNAIFPEPTFALYPVYSKMFRLKYRTVGYDEHFRLKVDNMLALIDKKTSILFLPNPNVPIEGTLDLNSIAVIARRCEQNGTFLAIDEVYFPFGGPTAISLINRFDNLFIMRSFSKAFGLAGIRLGYVVGSPKNIEYVSKTRTGYESNALSMEAASFFIDNYDIVKEYISEVKKGLGYLKEVLRKLGLEYSGAETSNFIYIELHDARLAKRAVEGLRRKNIYVRGNWPAPYAGGLTVAGAPLPMMKKFMDEFKGILGKK